MVMTALFSELFTHGGRVSHFSSLMGSQRRWPLGQGASALCLIINSTTDAGGAVGGRGERYRKIRRQTTRNKPRGEEKDQIKSAERRETPVAFIDLAEVQR